ncbi:RnfABCDGE type electron transport complex subunit B [Gemmatimonadota bacterium]
MLTFVTLILAAAVLVLLAVAMGWVLGWANRAFYVYVDPKVVAIQDALPGANCGGCGYVGCNSYADAIGVGEEEDLTLCGPGGTGCVSAMADILGIEVTDVWPYKAVVHCAAKEDERLLKMDYEGEPTCAAANLVAGFQGCTYGCMGLGDCVRVCDYDAMHIVDGVAVVDYEKCTGCKLCTAACPRNIITMVPFKRSEMFVVACSNDDFGKEVQSVCTVGCTGCMSCSRVSEFMVMEGNRPTVNYDAYEGMTDFEPILEKCKRSSLIFVGIPTEDQLAAVADEEVPDRIEPDFQTTVDDTEWRG